LILCRVAVGEVAAQEYADGKAAFDRGDVAGAVAIWRPLADLGAAQAQYALGVVHERGLLPVGPRPDLAAAWYHRAATQGHRDAQTNLGRLYAAGQGVPADPARAAELWRQAARGGHPVAQYNLALAYHNGSGLSVDHGRARHWLIAAAQQDLAAAQFALGQMYRLGSGVAPDLDQALAWYRRAAAQGHPEARIQAEALQQWGAPSRAPTVARDGQRAPMPRGATPGLSTRIGTAQDGAGARMWLGSMETRSAAERTWRRLSERFGSVLTGLAPIFHDVDLTAARRVTRLLAGPFPTTAAARERCDKLRQHDPGQFCRAVDSLP
jgi:TPR repeat protein